MLRKLVLAALVASTSVPAIAAQTPSPNRADQAVLASDPTFQNRVKESLLSTCTQIASEAITPSSLAFHLKRANLCAVIITGTAGPDNYKVLFAAMVSTDANVIADATASGATPLSSGNVATQAPLVTDAHIDAAVSGQFNTLLQLP